MSALLAFVACGSGNDLPPVGIDGPVGGPKGGPETPCAEGEFRVCSVTLGEHDGVLSCYHGTQACEGAEWQPCGNGRLEEQAAPAFLSRPGLGAQALSTAADCEDNPCDPFCQTFTEVPEDPVVAEDGGSIYDWEGGSLSDFPNGLVDKGLQEPCETGADCQFNMRCVAPDAGTCTHSVCEEGESLEEECSACAELVCAADEDCCGANIADPDISACSHDPCALGEGLDEDCNGCVAAICEDYPTCCNTNGNNDNWDQTCVDAVASVCLNSCTCQDDETAWGDSCYYYETTDDQFDDALDDCEERGEGWSLVTINDAAENEMISDWRSSQEKYIGFSERSNVWRWEGDSSLGSYNEGTGSVSPSGFYTNWDSGHPAASSDPDCAYMNDNSDTWRGETSCGSDAREYVCEGPGSVMVASGMGGGATGWGVGCVTLAETVCDIDCDVDDSSDTSGSCMPWYPGETDPNCAGVDLSVGVPCDGVIPVCNHGNTTALAPIELMHWPANSQQFPTCSPDLGHPGTTTCEIDEDIPPGHCVNVTNDDCDDDLGGNREIMVNPRGLPISTPDGNVDECSCLDNWSLFGNQGAACGEPICAGGSTSTTQVTRPVDIIVIVDNSPSMEDEIEEVQERIHTDLAGILAASDLDYRVIMVSRFGDVDTAEGTSAVNICIGAPLGANACTDAENETLVNNPPNYYHFSTEIESVDSWCQLLYGFNHADEVGVTDNSWSGWGSARTWSSLAPDGWGAWLREDAFKHFIIISDDDIDCSDYGYDFDDTASSSCEAFPHNCHDVTNQQVPTADITAGENTAQDFDDAILALSPEHFGTASERNYMWHSIINIGRHPDGDQVPWQPEEDMQRDMCTPSGTTIVGGGTGYQALSRLTGGLRYPICENASFDAIFNAVAEEVIETAGGTCEFLVADSNEVNLDDATVSYTDSDDDVRALDQVGSAADCGTSTSSWYFDDPDNPTTLTLCPDTCDTIQNDPGAQVWVEFGCPAAAEPTTSTEVYQASCPAGQFPQWAFFFYDTTIEATSDGFVSFRVRAATSEAGLAAATWQDAATATADAPDCDKAAPVPDLCPVDLYSLLGTPDAKADYLELEITIDPGSGTSPQLEDWEITFSCPQGE